MDEPVPVDAERIRVAVLGSPIRPEVEWTLKPLDRLRASGFTHIQLNIAWSYRPADEPLNLEDVWHVSGSPAPLSSPDPLSFERRQRLLAERSLLAKKAGLKTLFHFGAPFVGRAGYEGGDLPQCILDPETTDRYRTAVREFAGYFPDIDELLIYTYDQDAWLCSEFGGCDRCAGIPLHKRLPAFLNAIARSWSESRPGSRTWWEPWELSAGQTTAVIPHLDACDVGLVIHNSVGEVSTTLGADRFAKNVSAQCREAGIPVIAEVFLSSSSEETEPLRHLPSPLVTWRQLADIERVPGIVGVKEYFGIVPETDDVNFAAARHFFISPTDGEASMLADIADSYGSDASWLVDFWKAASAAYERYPWDISWFARQVGRSHPSHSLSAATIRGMQSAASVWDTPAWRSTRAATFIRVDNSEPHPWLLEDVELRFASAAAAMDQALSLVDAHLSPTDEFYLAICAQADACLAFAIRCRAYETHLRLTNLATLLRSEELPEARRVALFEEVRTELVRDRENQLLELHRVAADPPGGAIVSSGSSVQQDEKWWVEAPTDTSEIDAAIASLERDPVGFLSHYFKLGPAVAQRGQFSLTSR